MIQTARTDVHMAIYK